MENKNQPNKSGPKGGPIITLLLIGVIVTALLGLAYTVSNENPIQEINSSQFEEKIKKNEIKSILFESKSLYLYVTNRDHCLENGQKPGTIHYRCPIAMGLGDFQRHYDSLVQKLETAERQKNKEKEPSRPAIDIKKSSKLESSFDFLRNNLGFMFMLLILFAVCYYLLVGNPFEDRKWSKRKNGVGNKKKKVVTRLTDVQGMEEAKAQLADVIDFLKNPAKYADLGAQLPKGALLSGPPGTGKTLLAKAIAGECGVSFISVNGAEFDEVYVGLGARRIRKLFEVARKSAPCIIFIDEIDALASRRSYGGSGGNSSLESNTLNQLLTEIDGFRTSSGIFVIGSTNRVKVLDPAIVRPGRLGRQIYTSLPTIKERESCFHYYMKKAKKLGADVSAERLAQQTSGFSYAGIAEVCNEAIMIAARRGNTEVCMKHYDEAIDIRIGGVMVKEKILKGKERELVAYHEAGHALVSLHLPDAAPLVRVTIIPRTMGALGFAQYKNPERYLHQKSYLHAESTCLYGGAAAEEIIYGEHSTGAQNDFERAYQILYDGIAHYGMNDKVGKVSYGSSYNRGLFSRPFSEKVAAVIDAEVFRLQEALFAKAKAILKENRAQLEALKNALMEQETLSATEVKRLLHAVDDATEQAAALQADSPQPELEPATPADPDNTKG